MVGPNDTRPLQAFLLEDLDGGDVVPDFLLVLLRDAPLPPRLQGLLDQAPGELWQGGNSVVLEVESLRVPPLVGCHQPHRWVLADLIVSELDAGTPHRHVQLLPVAFLPLLLEGDGEEVPLEIKVGADL